MDIQDSPPTGTSRRVHARAAAVAALAVVIAMAAALPAASHTALVSASPQEGSTVEAPTQVDLLFNEALIDVGGTMSVADAQGTVTELTVTYPQPDTASATLPELAAGTATVNWRVVSADGHPVEGSLTFVVTAPPEPSLTADPSVTPEPESSQAPSPSASASASPGVSITPISAQPEPSGGIPTWLWVALVASLAAAGAVAVVTAKRR